MAQEKSCIRETLNLSVDAVKKTIFFLAEICFCPGIGATLHSGLYAGFFLFEY